MRVVELTSFTQAAESLGMPKAKVSLAVQQLENLTATRLLQRTTRRVSVTQDGLAFYERARDLLVDLEELEAMFKAPGELQGRLRMSLPVRLAKRVVIPRLPEFLERHPKVELEISSTDRLVDPVREGFDCVLRVGSPGEASGFVRNLGSLAILNCVSPAYLSRAGCPQSVEDLRHHRLVHYSAVLGARTQGEFEYWDGKVYQNVEMPSQVTVNNSEAYLAACLAGLGIIQVPAIGIEHYLKRGLLVEVLPQLQAEPMAVSLLYSQRRNLSRRLRAMIEWLSGLFDGPDKGLALGPA